MILTFPVSRRISGTKTENSWSFDPVAGLELTSVSSISGFTIQCSFTRFLRVFTRFNLPWSFISLFTVAQWGKTGRIPTCHKTIIGFYHLNVSVSTLSRQFSCWSDVEPATNTAGSYEGGSNHRLMFSQTSSGCSRLPRLMIIFDVRCHRAKLL